MSRAGEEEAIKQLLAITRQQIADGNGKEALENVIRAIIKNSGEASVMRILGEANKRAKLEKEKEIRIMIQKTCEELVNQESFLLEMGDEDILIDAFKDGSSVVCQKCKGLISVERAEAHATLWCPALEDKEDDDDS